MTAFGGEPARELAPHAGVAARDDRELVSEALRECIADVDAAIALHAFVVTPGPSLVG